MRHPSRRGFTLIELLVALTIGAMVLLGARGMLEALGTHASMVLRSATANDARLNADDILRRALVDLELRGDTVPSLDGDESAFTFRTLCDDARGWRESCEIRVAAERVDSGFQLRLSENGDSAIVLRRGLMRVAMRYLVTADEGGEWTEQWPSTLNLPRAIGIITNDDTIVVRVGDRR